MKRLLAVLLLAGCAANAQTPPPTVNGAALRHHPLYGTLVQYDRQIATLRATLHAPAFEDTRANIDAAIASMRTEIDGASAYVNKLVAQKADAYAKREDDAVSALLANADVSAPTQSDVRARVQQAYRAEYAQLRNGADSDMAHYRAALQTQQSDAYRTYVASVQGHTQQAYSARAQELREKESTLLLNLARKNSAKRLELRTKLQTLYLRPEQRRPYLAELQALQNREDRAVAALRAQDSQVLAAYREELLSRADSDIAHMAAELQSRTAANLAARRDVLAAQRAAPANLPMNGSSERPATRQPADLRAEVAAMRHDGRRQFQADADATVRAYTAARDDLTQRFTSLRDQDAASVRDTWMQISQLQRDRQDLYDQIVRDITSTAKH